MKSEVNTIIVNQINENNTESTKEKIGQMSLANSNKMLIRSLIGSNENRDKNIKLEKFLQLKPEKFKIGATEIVKIVFIENPTSLYVRRYHDISRFTTLMSEIEEFVSKQTDNQVCEELSVGDYVLHFYNTNSIWSRARVIKFFETNEGKFAQIRYIDYGATTVSKISL